MTVDNDVKISVECIKSLADNGVMVSDILVEMLRMTKTKSHGLFEIKYKAGKIAYGDNETLFKVRERIFPKN